MIEPPLVTRAREQERELGFERSSIPEVGRLLHVLAGQRGRTRVGELGTGCGVGAAWIVSALPPTVPFVTVELDEQLAGASASLFAGDENVTVLHGDWHELMPAEAPFDLLFYDGGGKRHPEVDGEDVVGLLAPGATIVMDDLTPGRSEHDPVRDFWLNHAEIAALELTTRETAAIVGTRRG